MLKSTFDKYLRAGLMKICVRSGIDCIILDDTEISRTVIPYTTSVL
jgi:hypothetical protein